MRESYDRSELRTRPRSLWEVGFQWIRATFGSNIRFRKYRVAPRLGTDTVRRRLLLQLRGQTSLAITETGVA